MAMPKGLSIPKIIALVNALAKLHNFCINDSDGVDCGKVPEQLNIDTLYMMNDTNGYVPMEVGNDNVTLLPSALMHGGHHFADVPRWLRRRHERQNPDSEMPRQKLLRKVTESHLTRPRPKSK